jgi:hypothetical protein
MSAKLHIKARAMIFTVVFICILPSRLRNLFQVPIFGLLAGKPRSSADFPASRARS